MSAPVAALCVRSVAVAAQDASPEASGEASPIAQSAVRPGVGTDGQTRGAGKTFLQASLAILVLLAVPELGGWAKDVQDGGTIDIDLHWWGNVLIAAAGGGIAALISLAWNWAKTPTPPNPVEFDRIRQHHVSGQNAYSLA